MEAGLHTQVSLPVVLINREGLYVIIAVLGVSILGCACVLTYSFTNYTKLKKNAEEVRNYISSKTKLAAQSGGGNKRVVASTGPKGHPRNRGKSVADLSLSAAGGTAGSTAGGGGPVPLMTNETYAIVAKQSLESEMNQKQPFFPRDQTARVVSAALLNQSTVVHSGKAATESTSTPRSVAPAA
ncbi:unnamed protein product [Ixodes persulcatus]